MADAILAIDAGTTNVLALVLGGEGRVLGRAGLPYRLRYPAPGLVEQDAEELWSTTLEAVGRALGEAGIDASRLGAVGITGQRTTTIVWDRDDGRPVGPAIGWQDQRGAGRAAELAAKGFFVNANTSASKLESLLDAAPNARKRMRAGKLAWGNVDSFIAWRLSGGVVHATDPSNACTTGYYDPFAGGWNRDLMDLQELDHSLFPKIVDTSGPIGVSERGVLGAEVPIGAIIGDQQSAAYAQGCLAPGEGKVTFGTSATCNVNTGGEMAFAGLAAQAYPLVLWRRGAETVFCLEGMVITAGAVFQWLAYGLGMIEDAKASSDAAAEVQDTHGVFFLPALQGLGTPHALPGRHALIGGLTPGARASHIIRAAMEGVAFRVREMLDKVYEATGLQMPDRVRVDGGAACNDVLMQIQADALGRPVERMEPTEATAFGAALLAGEAAGLWEPWCSPRMRRVERTFEPRWSDAEREARFRDWRKDCGLEEGAGAR